ncbi:MAG: HD domain-containing phosphohydrolase [bacterium]
MMKKILLVDDDYNILQGYKRHLHKNFQIHTVLGGKSALEMLQKNGPFAVVVSDLKMPGMNGIEFLSQVRHHSPNTVRILLTGQANMNDAVKVVNEGYIFRFLNKPCSPAVLRQAIEAGLEQYRLITAERELLGKTLNGVIKLLVDMLAMVNPMAFSRTNRVQKLAHRIAKRLNVKHLWEIDIVASLSQIGCITLSSKILEKKYRGLELSSEEKEIYLRHPQIGSDLLIKIPRFQRIAESIAYQEKNFDGTGPATKERKYGKAIPLAARILKAVNEYDTLVTQGLPPAEAVDRMRENSDWYDPDVLSAFSAEVLQVDEGFGVKEITVQEIEIGMIAADDIKLKGGKVLVPKRHEISKVLKLQIDQAAETESVEEPIRVVNWLEEDPKA